MIKYIRTYIFVVLISASYNQYAFGQNYPDQDQYFKSTYRQVVKDMFLDFRNKESLHHLKKIDSLKLTIKDVSSFDNAYADFAKVLFLFKYTTGKNQEIEDLFSSIEEAFSRRTEKSAMVHLYFNFKARYYRSIGASEKVIDVIIDFNNYKHLILPDDYNDSLSSLYYETFQFKKAIQIYKNIYDRTQEPLRRVSMLNNIGLAKDLIDEKEEAQRCFKKALVGIEEIIQDSALLQSRNSNINYQHENLQDFKNLITENLKASKDEKNSLTEKLKTHLNHSRIYLKKNSVYSHNHLYKIAFLYSRLKDFEQSNQYLDTLESNFFRIENHSQLQSKVKRLRVFNNLKMGKIEDALSSLELDTNTDESSRKYVALHKFQSASFEKEKKQISKSNTTIKWLISLISLGLILTIFIYSLRIRKKKRIEEQKAKFHQKRSEEIKAESDLLIKEANHRIMNSIQLAANLASLEKLGKDGKFDTQTFQLKMLSIGEIHKLIYSKNELYSTQDYIEEVISLLKNGLSYEGEIHLEITDKQTIQEDDLKYLGLLIIELIINSIKHSFQQSTNNALISIFFSIKSNQSWILNYHDNGLFNYEQTLAEYQDALATQIIYTLGAHYQIKNNKNFNICIQK
ncbi:MAG: hypothetical protein N4A45_03610 [Flavobacteriales bacterium]|jgi:two-component sensor histidine kinase|nr:hypothetical protein [Flavobacteriales bacterium]